MAGGRPRGNPLRGPSKICQARVASRRASARPRSRLTDVHSLPCWISNLLRGSTRREIFFLQIHTRELPLADGCARPRVGKPDAAILWFPPYESRGQEFSPTGRGGRFHLCEGTILRRDRKARNAVPAIPAEPATPSSSVCRTYASRRVAAGERGAAFAAAGILAGFRGARMQGWCYVTKRPSKGL